jgi:hypothetical protein
LHSAKSGVSVANLANKGTRAQGTEWFCDISTVVKRTGSIYSGQLLRGTVSVCMGGKKYTSESIETVTFTVAQLCSLDGLVTLNWNSNRFANL